MVAYFKYQNYLLMGAGAMMGLIIAFTAYEAYILPFADNTAVFFIGMFGLIGIILGRILSSEWSNQRLKSIYKILYQHGDAGLFLKVFAPMVWRVPKTTVEYVDGIHHLAYAYEGMGEYEKALEVLQLAEPEKLKLHQIVSCAIFENQRLRLHLLTENIPKSRKALRNVRELQKAASMRAPVIGKKIGECVRLAEIWLKLLENEEKISAEEGDYIKEELMLANNPIHKQEMQRLVAMMQEGR